MLVLHRCLLRESWLSWNFLISKRKGEKSTYMRFTTSSLAISKASCHSLVEDRVHKRLSSVSGKTKTNKQTNKQTKTRAVLDFTVFLFYQNVNSHFTSPCFWQSIVWRSFLMNVNSPHLRCICPM